MKLLKRLSLLALSLIFAGCAGYQLGSTLPEGVETVAVKVVNETDEPSIEVEVMKAIRAEIQFDGSLQLANFEENADAVILVTLTHHHLSALAFDSDRGELAREYRQTINASFVLYKAGGDLENMDDIILQSPSLRGDSEFPYASDLTTAKLGALRETSRDLARQVVSRVTSYWDFPYTPPPPKPGDDEAVPETPQS